jgi:hypothetical protein
LFRETSGTLFLYPGWEVAYDSRWFGAAGIRSAGATLFRQAQRAHGNNTELLFPADNYSLRQQLPRIRDSQNYSIANILSVTILLKDLLLFKTKDYTVLSHYLSGHQDDHKQRERQWW